LMTVPVPLASMVLPAMTVWPPSTANVPMAAQVRARGLVATGLEEWILLTSLALAEHTPGWP
jgi:hypothetical protein